MDAIKCAVEGAPFYCHMGFKNGEKPHKLCAGVMLLYYGEAADKLRETLAATAADEG